MVILSSAKFSYQTKGVILSQVWFPDFLLFLLNNLPYGHFPSLRHILSYGVSVVYGLILGHLYFSPDMGLFELVIGHKQLRNLV